MHFLCAARKYSTHFWISRHVVDIPANWNYWLRWYLCTPWKIRQWRAGRTIGLAGGRRWRASSVLVTTDSDLRYSTCYARRTVTPRFFVPSPVLFGEFLFQVLCACVIRRAEIMSRYSQRPENALKRANGK